MSNYSFSSSHLILNAILDDQAAGNPSNYYNTDESFNNNCIAGLDKYYYDCNNQEIPFDISEYVGMADEASTSAASFNNNACLSHSPINQEMTSYSGATGSTASSFEGGSEFTNMQLNRRVIIGRAAEDDQDGQGNSGIVAFRIQTELEILDDGYKWRKYGKKKVKSNSNPRNYYKCSHGGCRVKKRVERDGEDARFVIATYEGVHTHESLSATHTLPTAWSLQATYQGCFNRV